MYMIILSWLQSAFIKYNKFKSDQERICSLQHWNKIKQTSHEIKEKYQLGDY